MHKQVNIIGINKASLKSVTDSKSLLKTSFDGSHNQIRLLPSQNTNDLNLYVGLESKSGDLKENSRLSAFKALNYVKTLNDKEKFCLNFTNLGCAKATAEGAILANFQYDETTKKKFVSVEVGINSENKKEVDQFNKGVILGKAQNLARYLMELPANHLTPTIFTEKVKEMFKNSEKLEIHVRDKNWCKNLKMDAFLSVSRGSIEEPKFVEIFYYGSKNKSDKPYALVGKGVTFDSGGISIKPSNSMALMKGDMGGAAVVLATMSALEKLDLPINVVASIPLTENMPSGSATKPGDVVTAMNGKTIEIDNTDAEGRLILADAIYYTCITHKPKFLIEFSTLTGAMQVALGNVFAGVFTNSAELYQLLEKSGKESGDEFWKMPLDLKYLKAIKSNVADLKNVGDGNGAGSSTAAIFLSEFVPEKDGVEGVDKLSNKITEFAHVDIAGVMHNKGTVGYLGSGMTGRPTRSILELLCNLKQ